MTSKGNLLKCSVCEKIIERQPYVQLNENEVCHPTCWKSDHQKSNKTISDFDHDIENNEDNNSDNLLYGDAKSYEDEDRMSVDSRPESSDSEDTHHSSGNVINNYSFANSCQQH